MAEGQTTYGSIVGNYGRLYMSPNRTDSATSSTLEVYVGFASKYSVSDSNNTFYFNDRASSGSATTARDIDPIKTTVDTGSGWSSSNSKRIYTYTATYTRGTTDQTRYLYAKLEGVDRVGGTMYVSTTVTIPKLDSYTVKYNANGGTGAPSAQTKWRGKSLTLSSTKPARTGYSFLHWTDGEVTYAAGATYTIDESVTLSAVWKANTYKVTYNANGGDGAPAQQTKTYGTDLKLSSATPTRKNYTFKGWGTSAAATKVSYVAGTMYTKNAAITLYAIWELSYTKPRITNFSVTRCDVNKEETDAGTYALVKFDWACDKSVTLVKIERKLTSSADWTNYLTLTDVSGTSGSVSQRIGSNNVSTDNTYDIRVTVADGPDDANTTRKSSTLPGTKFVIDLKKGGNGIAFGKPAEDDGYMDVGYKARFRDALYADSGVRLPNDCAIRGRTTSGSDTTMLFMSTADKTIVGYGGYQGKFGGTNIYGDTVNIYSNSDVTINKPLHLTTTTDASGTADNNPALTIGSVTGAHLELDGNEIMAKGSGTTTATLYINNEGGAVHICGTGAGDVKMCGGGGNVYVKGCQMAVNKVLWSGGFYMQASHTINLDEAISTQANGIVLIWSYYTGTAVSDSSFNAIFVPKYFVSAHGSNGLCMQLNSSTGNTFAFKHVKINDTSIIGSSDNVLEEYTTTTGIKASPKKFVLRYVIGV